MSTVRRESIADADKLGRGNFGLPYGQILFEEILSSLTGLISFVYVPPSDESLGLEFGHPR